LAGDFGRESACSLDGGWTYAVPIPPGAHPLAGTSAVWLPARMTPEAFIAKWQPNTRHERAACHEHFIDLCNVLGEPTPNTDATGARYAFEKGAVKATGGNGWADVWRAERFAWEYKGKHKDLEAAHRQLLLYAGALGNPPLLVTSDIERIVIRTNWNNTVSARTDILLSELADPAKRQILKATFSNPDTLKPGKTRAILTAEAAAEFAELARRLRARGHDPQAVAHFVNRLVFCLFADDVGLLPAGLFERMLGAARKAPERFAAYASRLFRAMASRGGEVDFTPVAWFNGGLFDDDIALALERDDIASLERAAALDWADIDPSIMGTLFERGLDPDKRSQLGAHYTDREKIERLIDPVIRRPLLAEWAAVKAGIEAALQREAAAKPASRARKTARTEAEGAYRGFLDRVRAFRVLDPACGSGNFLYLSLLALKDIELQASVEAETLGLPREFPQVGPEAVLGIEINPYAAELARVSVWIGHIQWARRHGLPAPADPVLRSLDTIECRDAVLAPDGTRAEWPKVDAIVGNPPFLGSQAMIGTLGEEYTGRLRTAYDGRVPGGADLVCYWFERAREEMANGRAARAGLVATNSIRGGANRNVLRRIQAVATIYDAWSDEPWTVDGAAVRVSLVSFASGDAGQVRLDGREVFAIHADLSAGVIDLTKAHRLNENASLGFQGPVKVGPFDVPGATARAWLTAPMNPNGRPNTDVVCPLANGLDIVRRPSDTWIVDFVDRDEATAMYYAAPFAHVVREVKPLRENNRRPRRARLWWQHGETVPGLRATIRPLTRYIATPRVSKHRLFVWLAAVVLPDSAVVAIARDDDTTFGILHSRFHEAWALRLGTWLGVGNDPRYTPSTTFETFPFPEGLTPDRPAATYTDEPRAQAIATAAAELVARRDAWLNPPDLVDIVPEVVPGFPDRILPKSEKAAAILKTRTLTKLYNTRFTPEGAWLDGLHRRLDEAVAAAYGWPADIAEDDALARLLALNLARAGAAART